MPGLKIIVASVEFEVFITHRAFDYAEMFVMDSGKKGQLSGKTTCSIFRCSSRFDGTDLIRGYAHCSILDKFNTGTGRRLAFGRAALKMWPDKTDRTEAWAEFFRHFPWSRQCRHSLTQSPHCRRGRYAYGASLCAPAAWQVLL